MYVFVWMPFHISILPRRTFIRKKGGNCLLKLFPLHLFFSLRFSKQAMSRIAWFFTRVSTTSVAGKCQHRFLFLFYPSLLHFSFFSRSEYVCWYASSQNSYFSLTGLPFISGGSVRNHNDSTVATNEAVKEEDEWSMEVDLRSGEKEKRTLRWFVRGKQQKGFIKGVPDRVEFGVYYFFTFFLFHFFLFVFSYLFRYARKVRMIVWSLWIWKNCIHRLL